MSLDTALLSRKLEAYKREQDMARIRRDRRNDTNARKVQFVPKFAAKQFVATATPASAKPTNRNDHVASIQPIAEPVAHDGSSRLMEKSHVYAAMCVGLNKPDGVPTTIIPEAKPSGSRALGKRDSIYRPGDAAKRRSMFEMSYPSDITTHSDFHLQRRTSNPALQDVHLSHSLDRVKKSALPQLEESSRTSVSSIPRPKLMPNDRPDWIQRSENGDASQSHHGLHLFARTKGDHPAAQEGGSALETGHLVADAVKVIKRQEKSHRRKSVLEFFKKL